MRHNQRLILAAVCATGIAVSPASADRNRTRQQIADDVYTVHGHQAIEQFRADMHEVIAKFSEIHEVIGTPDSTRRLEAASAYLEGATDEEVALFVDAGVDLSELLDALDKLQLQLREAAEAAQAQAAAGPKTAGLPDAPYSLLCGFVRNNASAIETARIVFEVAQGVWSAASRACDQMIVAIGAGANTSLVCIAVDAVLFAAEFVFDRLEECNADIDSAELRGSYERLEHIHDDIECKWPGDVTVARLGHGCNGIDDDCSGVIDDCDEDSFGPAVHIDAAVATEWFRDLAEASAAVARATQVVDECQGNVVTDAPVLAGSCDAVSASVTARDSCNNESTAMTVVRVDATAPSITIDPAVADACFTTVAAAEAAVLAATVINDDCTADAEIDVRLDSTVTPCSLRVRLEAIDRAGNRSTAAISLRVDAELPVVDIEELMLGFQGAPLDFQTPRCYDSVPEAEAAVLAVTGFSDNCSATELIGMGVASAGDPCELEVTSTGIDECGNMNTDTVVVRVDDEGPSVTCSVQVSELFPPNHEMVDVGFDFSVTDNCSGNTEVEISIISDEPPELPTLVIDAPDPAFPCSARTVSSKLSTPDAEIIRDLMDGTLVAIRLRAERDASPPGSAISSGNGRVYKITVKAKDPCGNENQAICTVSVPVQCGMPAVADPFLYDPLVQTCPLPGSPVPVQVAPAPLTSFAPAKRRLKPGAATALRTRNSKPPPRAPLRR